MYKPMDSAQPNVLCAYSEYCKMFMFHALIKICLTTLHTDVVFSEYNYS